MAGDRDTHHHQPAPPAFKHNMGLPRNKIQMAECREDRPRRPPITTDATADCVEAGNDVAVKSRIFRIRYPIPSQPASTFGD
jgi:hypothetical protein